MAITVSKQGGFLKIDDDTKTNPEYVELLLLKPEISGNNVTVELGVVLDATTITLAGSSRTIEFTHNVNNYHSGALSATGLSSGSKTVSISGSTDCAGYYLEIKEAAATNNGAGFLMFMQ